MYITICSARLTWVTPGYFWVHLLPNRMKPIPVLTGPGLYGYENMAMSHQ